MHAATLIDGRRVAVKVQRPNCEAKLRGDIANLKSFSKKLADVLPVDYYTVFCELNGHSRVSLTFWPKLNLRSRSTPRSHTTPMAGRASPL